MQPGGLSEGKILMTPTGIKPTNFRFGAHCFDLLLQCLHQHGTVLAETCLFDSRWRHIYIYIRMRWAGHVASMGEERGCIGSWWGNRRERDTGET